jgi:hypothetical protein
VLITLLTSSNLLSRSQKSVPISHLPTDKRFRRDRRRSLSISLDERLEDDPDSFPQDMSCIGAECFPGRKRSVHGNTSDTEIGSKKQSLKFSGPLHHRKRNGDSVYNFTPTSSQELDPNLMKKLEIVSMHHKEVGAQVMGARKSEGQGNSKRSIRKDLRVLGGMGYSVKDLFMPLGTTCRIRILMSVSASLCLPLF